MAETPKGAPLIPRVLTQRCDRHWAPAVAASLLLALAVTATEASPARRRSDCHASFTYPLVVPIATTDATEVRLVILPSGEEADPPDFDQGLLSLEEVGSDTVLWARALGAPAEELDAGRSRRPRPSYRWKWDVRLPDLLDQPGNYSFRARLGKCEAPGPLFRVVEDLATPDWIRLTYAPEKTRYGLGEPIRVRFTLRNEGTAGFPYSDGGDYRGVNRHLRFHFTAESAAGERATDPRPGWRMLGRGSPLRRAGVPARAD